MVTGELQTYSSTYFDYDIFGELVEVYEEKALLNSLKLWIASSEGDFIGGITRGGYVTSALNIPLSTESLIVVEHQIKQGLANDFKPLLQVINLSVQPDYIKRRWEIELEAYAPELKMKLYVKESIKDLTS